MEQLENIVFVFGMLVVSVLIAQLYFDRKD